MGCKVKTQGQLLAEIFKLIVDKKVCPETPPNEWAALLLYLHTKGWLYFGMDKEENVKVAVAGYRIPRLEPKYIDTLPKKEKGKILYIPFYASNNGDAFSALKFLKTYLKQNKKKITEVAFYERGDNNKLKRFKINKGVRNEIKSPEHTGSAKI